MTEIIKDIILLSVASSVLVLLAPDGNDTKRYVKYVAGIVVAAMICTAIVPMWEAAEDFADSLMDIVAGGEASLPSEDGSDWVVKESVANIENGVGELIAARFSVGRDAVSVKAEVDATDKENVIITKLTVTLSGDGKYISAGGVEEYVSSLLGCETEVYYAD